MLWYGPPKFSSSALNEKLLFLIFFCSLSHSFCSLSLFLLFLNLLQSHLSHTLSFSHFLSLSLFPSLALSPSLSLCLSLYFFLFFPLFIINKYVLLYTPAVNRWLCGRSTYQDSCFCPDAMSNFFARQLTVLQCRITSSFVCRIYQCSEFSVQ